jgi:enoyl-CoA hydratase/carnithine racemase
LEINKAGDSYQIFNACHIVILTQERSRFGLWKVTAGEIVNFGIGYRLPEFLDGVEYRLAKLTTSQGKD